MLTTKLYIPPPRCGFVPRPRLVERMDEGLRLGRRMTLVSAPAGFGKTTLIAEWISRAKPAARFRVSWLTLDEGDNDPACFFAYLIAALRRLDEWIGQDAQSLLGSPQMPPAESLAAMLAKDLNSVPVPFALVLDDCQEIHAPAVHAALAFLLDHEPPRMHLVIATRTDPPLPLPRLRVRQQMTEIRADDLRFTASEAAVFLNKALGPALEGAEVAALEARTEGWIAGLQLAALSMRGKPDIAGFIETFSGSNRHVIDYLAEEVLAQQPQWIRDFLRRTSVLNRFCASLCDAVTGRNDGAGILRNLEDANLFLVPLDDRREWYRFHRLFADFLRTGTAPEQSAALHLRAARWFEARGLWSEAVGHALAHAEATGDAGEAVRVIIPAGRRALADGALVTLLGWLDALPDEVVRANGWLASFKAWGLLMTGRPEAAESYIRSAEAGLERGAPAVDRGRVLSLRCALSDPEDVIRMAPQALELMGDDDPMSRTGTLFMLGDAQDAVGDAAGAETTFREAHGLGLRHGHRIMAAVVLGHLAISIDCQGRRREARDVCGRGIERYADSRGNPLPVAALLHVVMGELSYEGNDLDGAQRYLQTGIDLGRQSATTRVILYGMESLARVLCSTGRGQEALATIREAQDLAFRAGESGWRGAGAAIEAGLLLREGDVPAARQWAESTGLPLDRIDQTRKYEYTHYVRVLLALKKEREAQGLLAKLEHEARRDGRRRHLLTVHIQQALTESRLGNEEKAGECIESALRLAAPEDYIRAFLEEDPSLQRFLSRERHAAPKFVDTLLAAYGPVFPGTGAAMRSGLPPFESLSGRELEVLRLLATGLSVPEIAQRLFVAASTIRSHVKHIYAKFDAHGRYEAVERAKSLGLF